MTRAAKPLIHCITNPISIHDCANIILASGGRPIMAEHPAEVAEITRSSHALALNLGNITDARMKSMPESLKTAASLHIPVMLDLVGTACSNLRYEFAQKLMNIHMPELLKGNMSELLAMSGQTAHAIGIDAGVQDVLTDTNRSHLKELFQEKASRWNTTLLITGKEDMIVSASKCEFITNGTPAMSQISRSFFADSSYMLSFSVLCSCVCSRLISPSVSSWHKQDNTLMHQSPGHIQRRTPYNF